MNTIFKNADILSLHIPLTKETRYLIDHQYLNKFSKNIFLINTSRGEIIKTSDLIKNIKTGKVIGAGLDVLENENINFENLNSENNDNLNFLKNSPNVILTLILPDGVRIKYFNEQNFNKKNIISFKKY